MPERRDERIDLGDLDQNAVDQPNAGAEREHAEDGERPRNAIVRLQADREDVPEHDAVADGEVDLAGDHRDHHAERQDGDDRLVGDDRADVQQRRESLGQEDAEQEREGDRQDHEPVDGHEALDPVECAEALQLAAGRFEGRRFDRGSHCSLLCRVCWGYRRRMNEPLYGKLVAADLCDNQTAREHQRAVADPRHLLEVGRHDDDAEARVESAWSSRR